MYTLCKSLATNFRDRYYSICDISIQSMNFKQSFYYIQQGKWKIPFGERSFSVAVPILWNTLPASSLCNLNSILTLETVSFEKKIMSKDKYPNIFSPQMETIVLIILQIFFATRTVLKIGEYSRIFPSFSWGIFGHVTCLDQSRASENIWWIIKIINNNYYYYTHNYYLK